MSISVGDAPLAMLLNGTTLYVANFAGNSVTVIDTDTNSVVTTILVGSGPDAFALTGNKLYVSCGGMGVNNNSVFVINTLSNMVMGGPIAVGLTPAGLAIDPASNILYVANAGDNNITRIDTLTDTVLIPNIPTPDMGPFAEVAIGSNLYVSFVASGTVRPMNTATNTFGSAISVGANPRAMFFNEPTSRLYVSNRDSSTVSVINTNTNTVVDTLNVGNNPLGFAKFQNTLYVANTGSDNLAAIDLTTNIVTGPIPAGKAPTALAVRNDTATLYIANSGDDNVTFFKIFVPCLHPSTLVETSNGLRLISDVKAGDYVIDKDGKKVEVIYNMQFLPSKEFVIIPKGSLGKSIPSRDLIIRGTHDILYKGREVKPKDLVKKVKSVTNRELIATKVFSLCTEKRTFIMMQGVPVATWQKSDVESPNFKYKIVKKY